MHERARHRIISHGAATAGRDEAAQRAIGRSAAALCGEGDAIIVNGGTTIFGRAAALTALPLRVFTKSFAVADLRVIANAGIDRIVADESAEQDRTAGAA